MESIKVYLQSPWKNTDSPYYLYLRETPPRGIEYVNAKEFKLIQSKSQLKKNNKIKSLIKKGIRNFFPNLPNAHFTKNSEKYDLIHCAHCLSLNQKNWISDIEYVNQFWAAGRVQNKRRVIKLVNSKYCKRIIAWTRWSYDSIIKEIPEIKNKVEILYPGIPEQKFKKIKSDKIILLFSARRFYFKGGLHALEVIDRLTKKYKEVEGIIVSDVPAEVLERYSGNEKIKFLGLVPQKELFEKVYPQADIFVYPSYTDTFGFQLTEALSFGLPVVTVGGHSRKEIISEGKTGFVIDEPEKWNTKDLEELKLPCIEDIERKTELLIKNKKLRNKMSKNCLKEIKNGKFSIKKRNKKLKQIYGEAMK